MKYIQIDPDGNERDATRSDLERALNDHQPHERAGLLQKIAAGGDVRDQFGYILRRANRPDGWEYA